MSLIKHRLSKKKSFLTFSKLPCGHSVLCNFLRFLLLFVIAEFPLIVGGDKQKSKCAVTWKMSKNVVISSWNEKYNNTNVNVLFVECGVSWNIYKGMEFWLNKWVFKKKDQNIPISFKFQLISLPGHSIHRNFVSLFVNPSNNLIHHLQHKNKSPPW